MPDDTAQASAPGTPDSLAAKYRETRRRWAILRRASRLDDDMADEWGRRSYAAFHAAIGLRAAMASAAS